MQHIVGFEFPSLDFVLCIECAKKFPEVVQKAVKDATGQQCPETIVDFAIYNDSPVAGELHCDLLECQKSLINEEIREEKNVPPSLLS